MPSVNVNINGKNYRMACDEGEEHHLEMLAREFDKRVEGLKGTFGEIGDQRLTVMAAVMVTDEMLELKKRLTDLEGDFKTVSETKNLQSRERKAGDDDLAKGIEKAADTIEKLSAALKGNTDPIL